MDSRIEDDKDFCEWVKTLGIDPEDMSDISNDELDDLYSYFWEAMSKTA